MKIVVISPKEYQGQISGNISSKRGLIEETSEDKGIAAGGGEGAAGEPLRVHQRLRSATKGASELLDGV